MINNRKAIIFGISSYSLKKSEINFLKKVKPWGIILFSRNIKSLDQLKKLVKNIKKIFKDVNFPILIDVEGGRVSRLSKLIDLSIFSQSFFEKLYKKNKNLFYTNYEIFINSVSSILNDAGININTAPVLDVRRSKSHNIIGDRSFSTNQNLVKILGRICIELYEKKRIATVIKHMPGHGLSKFDSHTHTPTIKNNITELVKKDFKPFKSSNSKFAMTAHIIYKKYDPHYTCTHSKKIIRNVIRNHIKFKGILISDDISMKSLKLSVDINAKMALRAGCNLILHCNAKLNEMKKISKVVPKIDKFTIKKTSDFYKFLR